MHTPLTLPFQNPMASQLALSGGKGANLSKMASDGFPVPDGFIVTTHAFSLFLDSLTDPGLYHRLLSQAALPAADTAVIAGQIRVLLENTAIPQPVIDQVRAARNTFDPPPYFAVRSSATAEDLPFLSFAGQQETYLNIKEMDSILDHIRKCWASLFTERAISYRNENHIAHDSIQMAVVVQKMVFPQVSGILFTADPVSNHHNTIVINAGYGLGEALVSGLVNPDLIEVSKADLTIKNYRIADKKMAIEAIPGGGTQKIGIPPGLTHAPALTDSQVSALTGLGIKVEKACGQPQDIEWAIENGDLYLLQSRPITSLFPLPQPKPDDDNLHVYLSLGHPQMYTHPISPMGISLLQLYLPFGRPPLQTGYSPYLPAAAGRLYPDVTVILNNPIGKHFFPKIITVADPIFSQQITRLVNTPEFQKRNQKPVRKIHFSAITDWFLPIIFGVFGILFFKRRQETSASILNRNQRFLDKYRKEIHSTSMPQKLLRIEDICSRFLKEAVFWHAPTIGSGFISYKLAEKALETPGQKELLKKVQRGLEGNITTEMDLKVADLAYELAGYPGLLALVHQVLAGTLDWDDQLLAGFPEFETKWQQFMARFGMRTAGEIDIALPRWEQHPHAFLQMLLSLAEGNTARSPHDRFSRLREESERSRQEILHSLQGSFKGRLKIPFVRRVLRVFIATAPLREHPKYMVICFLNDIRKELCTIAEDCVRAGQLDHPDDIWYLRMNELRSHFLETPLPLKQIVDQRRQDYEHFRRLTPPRVITSDGEILRGHISGDNFPEGALAGSPVSAGVIEGPARVITDPRRERLQPGEILVAPFTDPGWTPLFVNAAGLVLETGGLMSHGSVVAREYGIPAVVGILEATRIIKTGMRLRLNGDLGYVELIG